MRILVPVDGSPSANRATAHALLLAGGRSETESILVNIQNQATLNVSGVSGVMTVGADMQLAADQSKKALSEATRLCRNAQVKFIPARHSVPSPEQSTGLPARLKSIR
jgi:nucleotide-binding universal stress UspA family protein